jgi:hypothetical protein
MKTHGGIGVKLSTFLTSALGGGEWSAARPGRFISGETVDSTHWIGGCVDPRAGLDAVARRKMSLSMLGMEPQSSSPLS